MLLGFIWIHPKVLFYLAVQKLAPPEWKSRGSKLKLQGPGSGFQTGHTREDLVSTWVAGVGLEGYISSCVHSHTFQYCSTGDNFFSGLGVCELQLLKITYL